MVWWTGGEGNFTLCWVSLNNPETVKPWHFAAFNHILFETSVPNLLSLACPSLQILDKTQTRVFSISGFWSVPHKRELS